MDRERCPRCAKRGQDTRGDNLAVYPDKHKFCFACGYGEGVPVLERIRQIAYEIEPVLNVDKTYDFPEDYTTDLPKAPLTWLKNYGITGEEIKQNRFGWSNNRSMLVFPVFDGDGHLIMWQGRYFGGGKTKKYHTKGPASDIMHLVGQSNQEKDTIVLTEDLLSAIKVGRRYQAMPLWGSHIPLKLIQRLSERFRQVGIWLDRDKTEEAVRAVLRASQYMRAFVVTSAFDPKEYSTGTIEELIETAMLADSVSSEEVPESMAGISAACRRLDYAEAKKRFPMYIRNLSDYCKIRNSFDNVKEHEVRGPYEA